MGKDAAQFLPRQHLRQLAHNRYLEPLRVVDGREGLPHRIRIRLHAAARFFKESARLVRVVEHHLPVQTAHDALRHVICRDARPSLLRRAVHLFKGIQRGGDLGGQEAELYRLAQLLLGGAHGLRPAGRHGGERDAEAVHGVEHRLVGGLAQRKAAHRLLGNLAQPAVQDGEGHIADEPLHPLLRIVRLRGVGGRAGEHQARVRHLRVRDDEFARAVVVHRADGRGLGSGAVFHVAEVLLDPLPPLRGVHVSREDHGDVTRYVVGAVVLLHGFDGNVADDLFRADGHALRQAGALRHLAQVRQGSAVGRGVPLFHLADDDAALVLQGLGCQGGSVCKVAQDGHGTADGLRVHGGQGKLKAGVAE